MVKDWLKNGSSLLVRRQTTILSAATIIMVMVAASRVLGLVRNRVLAHYFSVEVLSLYFAAFRLPEVFFEVLVFGTLSSAFIPTFTSYLSKNKKSDAWHIASASLNITMLFFLFFASLAAIFMPSLYRLIAAGFTPDELKQIVSLSRILLLTQGFFVVSYFLTGILESMQRFLVPAIAPLFYNLGIILGAVLLSPRWGIYGPTIGAAVGAFLHFAIQLPAAFHLGFKYKKTFDHSHPGVKKIGRLAAPRIIELSFIQVSKSVELFLASMISTASYTYYTFASSLQLLPISLFGMSIAKASLPILSYQATKKNLEEFKKLFLSSFHEILFFTAPCSVFLAVLRIPIVRLVFGTARFTWASTVETGYTLSAFCLGIFAQSLIYLLARAFYALHDTATPVKVSIGSILFNVVLSLVLVLGFHGPIWYLALSFSLTSMIQISILIFLLDKKVGGLGKKKLAVSFGKITAASFSAGGIMFFLLKIFDYSAWDKRLSFLGRLGLSLPTSFNHFVLDTRYAANLLMLTCLVFLVGVITYLFLAWVFKLEAVTVFSRIFLRFKKSKVPFLEPKAPQDQEIITGEETR